MTILTRNAKLAVLSSAVSQRTLKKFQALCSENVDMIILDDDNNIGKSVGRDGIK